MEKGPWNLIPSLRVNQQLMLIGKGHFFSSVVLPLIDFFFCSKWFPLTRAKGRNPWNTISHRQTDMKEGVQKELLKRRLPSGEEKDGRWDLGSEMPKMYCTHAWNCSTIKWLKSTWEIFISHIQYLYFYFINHYKKLCKKIKSYTQIKQTQSLHNSMNFYTVRIGIWKRSYGASH